MMFSMVIGVIVFGDFLGNLSSIRYETFLEKEKKQLLTRITGMRKDYNLKGRSMINLEYLMFKLEDQQLIEDYNFIKKLPRPKSNQVFENIKQNFEGYISFFREINLESFIMIFREIKMQF